MTLEEILEHRRAVRKYAADKELDSEKVKECIRLATLAPTSSNMQLWEAYHVTDSATLQKLSEACLGQGSAKSCKQMVVFVMARLFLKPISRTLSRTAPRTGKLIG